MRVIIFNMTSTMSSFFYISFNSQFLTLMITETFLKYTITSHSHLTIVREEERKTGGDKQGKDGKENKRREKLTNSNGATTLVQTLCKVLQVPALM